MISRLRPLFPAARRDAWTGAAVLVAAAAIEVVQPWPIKWLVDYVFGAATPPEWLRRVAPFLGRSAVGPSILFVCATVILLALALKAFTLVSQLLLIRAGNTLVLQLRSKVSDHLLRLHLAYHDQSRVGDSLYRLAYDTTSLQTLLSQGIAPVVHGILVLSGIAAVMLAIDPILTIVALAAAPVYWLAIRLFGELIRRRSKAYHDNEASLAAAAAETLSSIRAVQAYTAEQLVHRQIRSLAGKSHKASQRLVLVQLAFSGAIGVAMALGTAAVVYIGAHRVAAGRLTIGDILIFLAYLGTLYQPMNAMSQSSSVVHSVRSQLDRVFQLLDTVPAIVNSPAAVPLNTVLGRIELDGVSFAYETNSPVLTNISLEVPPGQTVAIVGRTGSGKSTLASLLLRFYDPTSGAIRLDGRDLRDLPLAWLRRQAAVVLQEPILFSATIAQNIAYANPDATADDIRSAARRAQVDTFIESLPDKYEAMLGERGVNLSGGQRQRLGIARAFLKNAPILILDEPTSALDAHTESALVNAIAELTRGRTTFIIAHRLSTIRLAHSIVVLEAGRIVEQGTHRELMRNDTAYRRLYRTQWGLENEADELPVEF
jgi:ATP-binding cassette subfamily B protein/subfamily B ATP-binding cassette protein MsbA